MMVLIVFAFVYVGLPFIVGTVAARLLVDLLDRFGLVYDPAREDPHNPARWADEPTGKGKRLPVAVGPGRKRVHATPK